MDSFRRLFFCGLVLCLWIGYTQAQLISFPFTNATPAENGVTVIGAGFGSIPAARVTFGPIPTADTYEGATDGYGMIIQANPGEGVMILTNPIQTDRCALIRCAIRASAAHVSAYIATIDQGQDIFVSTITTNNSQYFLNRYNRLAGVFMPPSTGFQGIVQIINTSQSLALTVYIDNLEILFSSADRLDFAVNDFAPNPVVPTPTPTDTATQTPTASNTPVPPTPTPTSTPLPPTLTPTPTPQGTPVPTGMELVIPLALPEGAIPLRLRSIPAGTFLMGSPLEEPSRNSDEGPQHPVTITQPFYIGQYEVTQAQWQAVMGSNPSWTRGENHPVERVSWEDVQEFLLKLNQLGLGMGTFRLPTEAEWEYACRAGTVTRYYWGNDLEYDEIENYAWYAGNAAGESHPVGEKRPNPWGLYDMSGSVWEWCLDWHNSNQYTKSAETDPIGAASGTYRVCRSGYWGATPQNTRSAVRGAGLPHEPSASIGFRVLMTYPAPTPTPTVPTPTPAPPTPTPTPVPPTPTPLPMITIPLELPEGAMPLEMVQIPAGSFLMGAPDTETGRLPDEGPQHQVTITKPFYMGKYEVTQALWNALLGDDPFHQNPSYFKGENLPVEQVTWQDAQLFIEKLNQLGLGTFRLPTEAEWEYACRAGTTTRYYWGDDPSTNRIAQYAWYQLNAGEKTHPVGTKLPNAWGLYDMSGNVFEWCNDWYGETAYNADAVVDPTGPESGTIHVLRGGYWNFFARYCRSAFRNTGDPKGRVGSAGFRLVREVD